MKKVGDIPMRDYSLESLNEFLNIETNASGLVEDNNF